MHSVRGRQNDTASGRKSQSHESMARHFQARRTVGRDLHNASLARERTRHVQVTEGVKSQPLRTSQAAEECMYSALRVNSVYAIKTRGGRPGHK